MNGRWTFTLNNPGEYRPRFDVQQVAYMVYQLEEGDAEHTPHLQGYIRFINRKRFATVVRYFENEGVHLEQAKGSEEQNKAYCTKEPRIAGPWEFGTYDAEKGDSGDERVSRTSSSSVPRRRGLRFVGQYWRRQDPPRYESVAGGLPGDSGPRSLGALQWSGNCGFRRVRLYEMDCPVDESVPRQVEVPAGCKIPRPLRRMDASADLSKLITAELVAGSPIIADTVVPSPDTGEGLPHTESGAEPGGST